MIDAVTVYHRAENKAQADAQTLALLALSGDYLAERVLVDNETENRGFSRACNEGARQCGAPLVLFLNPDVELRGDVLGPLVAAFEDPDLVIAGEAFGLDPARFEAWGCADWVCGALFCVRRSWFEAVGGFCEDYVWGFEETDLIRLAQEQGRGVRSMKLPAVHSAAVLDGDQRYKSRHMTNGRRTFEARWMGK